MKPLSLDESGWEMCAHKHTPMGSLPDLSDRMEWPWQSTSLPFDVISSLHSSGHGPDPAVGFNDSAYSWVEDVDWVLRKTFTLSSDFYEHDEDPILTLKDLDCYFEAFLNGVKVGSGMNQFRPHVFDLEEAFLNRDTDNELLIYIRSARNVTSMMEAAHGQLPAGFDTSRVHARRCQSITGWDWTPRLSSASLLSPPEFKRNDIMHLANVFVTSSIMPDVVPGQVSLEFVGLSVTFDLQSRRRASGELTIRVIDSATDQIAFERVEPLEIKPKTAMVRRTFDLPEAAIWWPLGMGSQPLYRLEIELIAMDKLGHDHILSDAAIFGVRSATVERRKDSLGESFIPMVNGVPVFCRGANWIPVSMLAAQAHSTDLKFLLGAAVAAGLNCLRVWGGGIYETDEFYNICDATGILVWQDFMFACAAYPTYREFLDEVEAEAVYQVTRLRNHPCLLLWCGNNENEWLHQTGDLKKGNEQKIIGETIWSHLIRQVVEDYDPSRIYHQSSPFGRSKTDINDEYTGDRHNWDAWSGWQSSNVYLQDKGRFITEFGFQSFPCMETVGQFAPYADSFNHPDLLHHQKMIEGQERLARYVAAHYEIPVSLDEWSKVTQQLQAEILRRAVEHWRRQRFNTAGCLIWQLHDAYSAVSWSLMDFYRRPKQAYVESRRFFAPVLLSMELLINGVEAAVVPPEYWPGYRPPEECSFPTAGGDPVACKLGPAPIQTKFYVINDSSVPLEGEVVVEFLRTADEPVVLDTITVSVPPNETLVVLTHDIGSALLKDIAHLVVRGGFHLNESSQTELTALGNQIRKTQLQLAPPTDQIPAFSEDAGLHIMQPLVEPKYFKGQLPM